MYRRTASSTRAGRPSKGERVLFQVKLDSTRGEKLKQFLELIDEDGIEHLTPIVAAYVDTIDLQEAGRQEELPLTG